VFLEGFQAVCRADYGVVDCRAAGWIGGGRWTIRTDGGRIALPAADSAAWRPCRAALIRNSDLICKHEQRLRKALGNWVFSITNSFPLVALRRIIWQQGCTKVYALPDAIAEPIDD
jgi:hypothetical protein